MAGKPLSKLKMQLLRNYNSTIIKTFSSTKWGIIYGGNGG